MGRSQAAKDRRALKRERKRYAPDMSLREYLAANAALIARDAENKRRNAECADAVLAAYLSPGRPDPARNEASGETNKNT